MLTARIGGKSQSMAQSSISQANTYRPKCFYHSLFQLDCERDIVWRDKLLSDSVEKKMGDKTGLDDAATLEVATEYNLSVDTVRKAYDKRNKKVW